MAAITLLHGDCLELLPSIPDGSVDLVCADLPYGVTQNKWDTPIDLGRLWAELLRVGKRNAAFVFTATFKFACALESIQPKLGLHDLVWEKGKPGGFLNAKRQPLRAHEMICVFYRAQPTYNPQMQPGGRKHGAQRAGESGRNYGVSVERSKENLAGVNYPRSVLFFPAVNNKESMHPTQKPVALLEWLIRTYTNPGDTVLDPTAGSFTTGVACVQTGRRCVGIEKDAAYFEAGKRRVEAAQPPLPGAA